MKKVSLVIIGGGSAGLAAALGAFNEGIRDILILEKDTFLGGILNQCIHPGFGLQEFKTQLTGPEYAERFINDVVSHNISYRLNTMVTGLTKERIVTYFNTEEGLVSVEATAVILATGCYERNSGSIGLPGDRPKGVITAGLAQRYLNMEGYLVGKRIFILGSGDIGLIMARRMTLEGAKVLGVAEIMPYSNGLTRNVVQCLEDYDIPLYLSHTVSKVIGKTILEKIIISAVDSSFNPIPGSEIEIEVDTLLLSIGLLPSNELLDRLKVDVDRTRGAKVDQNFQTSIPGIFSCGNVLHVHDLVDFVSAEGRRAGQAAAQIIQKQSLTKGEVIEVKAGEGVNYVVPQRIDLGNLNIDFDLKFRVRTPKRDQFVIVRQGGKIIKRVFKQVLIPSEMLEITISKTTIFNHNEVVEVFLEERKNP
jgi:thioredoxin reductase